jgi:hypothetical protein
MKFKTKTYNDAVEMAAKMLTVDSNSTAELAMIAFIYGQHSHKVMQDIQRFHKRWARLIAKDNAETV